MECPCVQEAYSIKFCDIRRIELVVISYTNFMSGVSLGLTLALTNKFNDSS